MTGIYKIISPSGKVYIGQSMDIYKRWKQYEKLYCKKQCKLYNSLKKHTYKNHQFGIIEECTTELLNERESFYKQQFINEFGWKYALFCEIYDQFSGPQSEETKQKKSLSLTGRKFTLEHINNMRLVRIGKPKPLGFNLKTNKPIIQYDLQDNFIKEWSSGKEAAKTLTINPSDISACCKGKQKTAKGFKFKYKEICGLDLV